MIMLPLSSLTYQLHLFYMTVMMSKSLYLGVIQIVFADSISVSLLFLKILKILILAIEFLRLELKIIVIKYKIFFKNIN